MKKTELTITIGKVLKEFRIKSGISIEQAAKMLKISPSTIKKAEDGYDISFYNFFGLAEVYNVKPSEISAVIRSKKAEFLLRFSSVLDYLTRSRLTGLRIFFSQATLAPKKTPPQLTRATL